MGSSETGVAHLAPPPSLEPARASNPRNADGETPFQQTATMQTTTNQSPSHIHPNQVEDEVGNLRVVEAAVVLGDGAKDIGLVWDQEAHGGEGENVLVQGAVLASVGS